VISCPEDNWQDRRKKTSDLGGFRERQPAIFCECVFCAFIVYSVLSCYIV